MSSAQGWASQAVFCTCVLYIISQWPWCYAAYTNTYVAMKAMVLRCLRKYLCCYEGNGALHGLETEVMVVVMHCMPGLDSWSSRCTSARQYHRIAPQACTISDPASGAFGCMHAFHAASQLQPALRLSFPPTGGGI